MGRTPKPPQFAFTPPTRPRRGSRAARGFIIAVLLGTLAIVSSFYGFMTAIAQEIPKLESLRFEQKANGVIYAADGKTVLAILRSDENRIVVPSEKIAPIMKQAVVSIEDRRYYEHGAVDPVGLTRAAFVTLITGEQTQGGSTITQQFVKNAYTDRSRSVRRKVREAALAYQLERRWSKDRILTAYLNNIYFGHNAYGVEAAARVYFGTHAHSLLPWQAALLAAMVQAPSRYDPVLAPKAALDRRNLVLEKMTEEGYVSPLELSLYVKRPLTPKGHKIGLEAQSRGVAAYFTQHVKDQLAARYGDARMKGGGLRVYTTIDLRMQRAARAAVRKELGNAGPAAGLVAIDPRSGQIKAMIGGKNFSAQPFNLATQARRQPGSAFKPFVLTTALEQGILPQTHFTSRRVYIPLNDRLWYVRNDTPSYAGSIPLNTAIVLSDNTVFAQLTMRVGPANVRKVAHALGITSTLDAVPAIGLGGLRRGVSPLEMAHAYATLSNGGERVGGSLLFRHVRAGESEDPSLDPIAITRVEDADGHVLEENKPRRVQVVDRQNALAVVDMLKPVIRVGTAKRIAGFSRPAAGKTGTTTNFVDAWFAGITPQLATAVWVGYVNPAREMLTEFHGDEVFGGTFPTLIWRNFMDRALSPMPVRDWDPPSLPGGAPVFIDTTNGKLSTAGCASAREQVMEYDRIPTQYSPCKGQTVLTPDLTGFGYTRAQDALDATGLIAQPVWTISFEGDPPGTVIGQIPGPSEPAKVNQKVKVILSKPTQWVALPDVRGEGRLTAVSALRNAGFKVRTEPVDAPGKPGSIVYQTPGPGDQPRGRSVTLLVARRPAAGLLSLGATGTGG